MAAATVSSPKVSPHRPNGLLEVTITRGSFVAGGDELEEQVGGFGFEGDVADFVDDDQRVAAETAPYRSGGQAMQDLLAGRVDYQCPSAPTAMPQIVGMSVKALAVLSKNRSPSMPTLASAHEQGLTDFDIPSWYALFLPKGTPDAIVQKLRNAMIAAMDTPAMQDRMRKIGSDLVPPERRSSEYLGKFVVSEIEKWSVPIKASGVQIE